MLALIAGQGDLPRAVVAAMPRPPLICVLDGMAPQDMTADYVIRLERLGSFLHWLKAQGVTQVCMCGAVRRPKLNWRGLDLATLRLIPQVLRAFRKGDDGALRIVIGIFETAGFEVLAAHEAVPELLPISGVPTVAQPSSEAKRLAGQADQVSAEQAAQDLGQACVIARSGVVAREDSAGTDAMLAALGHTALGGVFFKAPKPGQERRADLPVIGPGTAIGAAKAGLAGLVIEANGVMVLNYQETLRRLDAEGLFLWIRERPE